MTATAFQSIDGIKCDKILFRGKKRILHDAYLLLFEGHLRKNCGIFYAAVYPQEALAFLVGSSVVGLGSQGLN